MLKIILKYTAHISENDIGGTTVSHETGTQETGLGIAVRSSAVEEWPQSINNTFVSLRRAAIGAVAAGLLPVVTWPIGLAAGAAFALHQRIKR